MPLTEVRSVSNIEPGAVICAVASARERTGSLIERRRIHWRFREECVAVVLEFFDRFANVVERTMRGLLLRHRVKYFGVPPARQFLQGRHVDVAVVKELFERRHVLLKETAVGADGIRSEEHTSEL